MAKSTVDAIRQAEQAAVEAEAKANENAQKIIDDAAAKADGIIKNLTDNAKKQADDIIGKAESITAEKIEKAKLFGDEKAAQLINSSVSRQEEVNKKVMNIII